jgi:hypothetical protein
MYHILGKFPLLVIKKILKDSQNEQAGNSKHKHKFN